MTKENAREIITKGQVSWPKSEGSKHLNIRLSAAELPLLHPWDSFAVIHSLVPWFWRGWNKP